ncbi:MAG: hypothetical protein QXT88_00180 [Desulfurococcaceae archaeon]|uniref:Uncharacterized protein n=1 Tax=Staphylothermus marinus TaxID=2280 RepID=A0A7C4NM61_STAMA
MKNYSVIEEIKKILELHDVKIVVKNSIVKAKIGDTPFNLVIDLKDIGKNIVNVSLEFEEDPSEYLEKLLEEHDDINAFRDAVEIIVDEIHNINSKLMVVLRKKGIDVVSSVIEDLDEINDVIEELIEERG